MGGIAPRRNKVLARVDVLGDQLTEWALRNLIERNDRLVIDQIAPVLIVSVGYRLHSVRL